MAILLIENAIMPNNTPANEPKVPGAIGNKPTPKKVIIILLKSILLFMLFRP